MQVRIISRETIKPSSPTPSHLKTLKFSLFDQIAPKSYIPTCSNIKPAEEITLGSSNTLLPFVRKGKGSVLYPM